MLTKHEENPLAIQPEHLEVAEAYIRAASIDDAARDLEMPKHEVVSILNRKEVKTFIDEVFLDSGYRNRTKIAAILDEIIDKKLEELKEADMGSGKDILDILAFAHKLRMAEIEAAKEKTKEVGHQTNVQYNFGENYTKLMEALHKGKL